MCCQVPLLCVMLLWLITLVPDQTLLVYPSCAWLDTLWSDTSQLLGGWGECICWTQPPLCTEEEEEEESFTRNAMCVILEKRCIAYPISDKLDDASEPVCSSTWVLIYLCMPCDHVSWTPWTMLSGWYLGVSCCMVLTCFARVHQQKAAQLNWVLHQWHLRCECNHLTPRDGSRQAS